MFNRLYILSDAFLIKVFLLYSVVFARSCYGGPLLGIVLVDIYKYKPLLFNIYLPCNIYILGGFSRYFLEFFWLVLVFLGQVQQELQKSPRGLVTYSIHYYYILNHCIQQLIEGREFFNIVFKILQYILYILLKLEQPLALKVSYKIFKVATSL